MNFSSTLRKGNLVVFPTDTLYALGADATNCKAVDLVFKAKHRSKNQPIIVGVSSIAMLSKYSHLSSQQKKIILALSPGPYTFILKPKCLAKNLAKSMVGFRIPRSKKCLALIRSFNKPVTITSANTSGKKAFSLSAIKRQLPGVQLFISAGILKGKSSTIIDLQSMKILRKGRGLAKARKLLKTVHRK